MFNQISINITQKKPAPDTPLFHQFPTPLRTSTHRRIPPKTDQKTEILKTKLEIDKQALEHLKKALPKAKKSKGSVEVKEFVKNKPKVDKDGKKIPIPPADANKGKWEKRSKSLDQIKKAIVRMEDRIKKQEADIDMKVRAVPCYVALSAPVPGPTHVVL